jgi:hypothetical protein
MAARASGFEGLINAILAAVSPDHHTCLAEALAKADLSHRSFNEADDVSEPLYAHFTRLGWSHQGLPMQKGFTLHGPLR